MGPPLASSRSNLFLELMVLLAALRCLIGASPHYIFIPFKFLSYIYTYNSLGLFYGNRFPSGFSKDLGVSCSSSYSPLFPTFLFPSPLNPPILGSPLFLYSCKFQGKGNRKQGIQMFVWLSNALDFEILICNIQEFSHNKIGMQTQMIHVLELIKINNLLLLALRLLLQINFKDKNEDIFLLEVTFS